jgi:acyl-CoA oxidase
LIPERLGLLTVTTQMISQALTIATRYGVVRRQGPKNQQIMDYQSHYVKLIPAISFMYMMQSASTDILENFNVLTSGGKIEDPIVYLNHMGEMHAVSASIKGLSGWYASDILETCRRCCGGHAYSAYNAIGHITNDWGVMVSSPLLCFTFSHTHFSSRQPVVVITWSCCNKPPACFCTVWNKSWNSMTSPS